MNYKISIISCLTALIMLSACSDYETYGEKKDKERDAIAKFISDSAIVKIDESTFLRNDTTTDTGKNQFVTLKNSGVYMQIVNRGVGEPLKDGENCDLLVKFREVGLRSGTEISSMTYEPDIMNIRRTGDTYTATFTYGIMKQAYGDNVPEGWLVPFQYIRVGRERSDNDKIATVKLIVPHTQGHNTAKSYVYPYYYEISFQRSPYIDEE